MKKTKILGTSSIHLSILAVAIFSIIFIEWKKSPIYAIFDISILSLLILWISSAIKNKSWIIKTNQLTRPLLAFGVTGIISGIFAFNKIDWAVGVLGIFIGILMVHILAHHIRKKEQVLLLFDLLLMGGFIIALIGIYQWMMFHKFIPSYFPLFELAKEGDGIYITSLINDISRTAAYWSFMGPLALSRFLFPLPKESLWKRVLWGVIFITVMTVIFLGNMKSPLLAFALLGIYLIYKSKKRFLAGALILLFLGMAITMPSSTVGRFKAMTTSDFYLRSDNRPALQINALKAWLERGILIGTGINNHGTDRNGKGGQAPHSLFISLLGETGLLGFLAFLWLLKQFYVTLPQGNGINTTIKYAAGSMMTGGMIGGLSYHVLIGPPTINIFWILIAISMSFTHIPNLTKK